MSENFSHHDARACGGVCGKLFVGLVLLSLVRTSEALAGEQPSIPGSPEKLDFGSPQSTALSAPMLSIPENYQAVNLPEHSFSTQDFRPRAHAIFESEARASTVDVPMIRGTVWQRLSEYRSHDRVRLLTLWETSGSSVSLQAGKKGAPSLQWTSRLMNRGGATRGLLDQLFSASLAGAGRSLHFAPHAPVTEPAGKPAKLDIGAGATK